MAEAALVVGVSERQCYRIKAQVTRFGEVGAFTPGDPVKPDLLSGFLHLRISIFTQPAKSKVLR